MMRICYCDIPGLTLEFSVKRMSDMSYYDFSTLAFAPALTAPVQSCVSLPMESPSWPTASNAIPGWMQGSYEYVMTNTPQSLFPDGDYRVGIHSTQDGNRIICFLGCTMKNGDDTAWYTPQTIVSVAPATP